MSDTNSALEGSKADLGPSRPKIPHWTGWVLPLIGSILVTIGSVAGGWALSLDAGSAPDKNFYMLASALCGLLGLGLIATAQAVSLLRHRTQSIEITNFNDHLSGVHQALTDLVRSDKRSDASREFFRSAIRQGVVLLGLDGVRVCVYQLDAKEGEGADEQLGHYLRLVDFSGRNDLPRNEFDMSTEFGRAMVEAAVKQRQVTVADRDRTAVPIDFNPGTVWRSFFLVPLVDGTYKSRGLLTVDTREKTKFTYVDVAVARTLASLIVIGMDELYSAAKDTEPELSGVLVKLSALPGTPISGPGGAK